MKIPSISGFPAADLVAVLVYLMFITDWGWLPDDLIDRRLDYVEGTVYQYESTGRPSYIDIFWLIIDGDVESFRIGGGLGGRLSSLAEEVGDNTPVEVAYYDSCPFYMQGQKCRVILSISSVKSGECFLSLEESVGYFNSNGLFYNNKSPIIWFLFFIGCLLYVRWRES